MHTISLLRVLRAPLRNSSSKILEHSDGAIPVNASVGDRHALLERTGALGGNLLVALVDVGLDHDGDNAGFALADLVGDDLGDLGLVSVVLVGVAWDLSVVVKASSE